MLTARRSRHIRPPLWRPETADNRHGAKLLENPANIALSRQNGKLINGSAPGIKARHPSPPPAWHGIDLFCIAWYWLILHSMVLAHSAYYMLGCDTKS